MKAVVLKEVGNIENLQFIEIERPTILENEVLVQVKSISINPVDVNARAHEGVLKWIFGNARPIVLGWDISGEVVEKGSDVANFRVGDEVFGMVNFLGSGKAYAEYVASPASHLALKPNNVSHQQAAAATLAASTAYQALVDVAKIRKGDRVLVHAASGGVGHMAIQIAKHFGAYVVGTSSAKNRDFVLSLGADEHIDYINENFDEKVQDMDIVLDTIQGETLLKSFNVVRTNGIIVTLPTPEISKEVKNKAYEKQIRVEFLLVDSKNETITAIAELLKKGDLKPHIHKIFPFEEIGNAHLEVETKHVVGKVIVNI